MQSGHAAPAVCQVTLDPRIMRNAQIANPEETISPTHDTVIGITASSTWIDKPYKSLSKCTNATKVNIRPDTTQYPLPPILLLLCKIVC